MSSLWSNYGFPDPTFYPAWKPAEGLVKALRERELALELPYITSWDTEIDSILSKDTFTTMQDFYEDRSSNNFRHIFDLHLGRLVSNPGLFLPKFMRSPNEVYNFSTLLLDAAGGDPTKIIHSTDYGDGAPEYLAAWLIQRKKALDLLKCPGYYNNIIYRPFLRDFYDIYTSIVKVTGLSNGNAQFLGKDGDYQMSCKIYIAPSFISINGLKYKLSGTFVVNVDDDSVLPSLLPFRPGPVVLDANSSYVFWEDEQIANKVSGMSSRFEYYLTLDNIILDFSQVFKFYDPPET